MRDDVLPLGAVNVGSNLTPEFTNQSPRIIQLRLNKGDRIQLLAVALANWPSTPLGFHPSRFRAGLAARGGWVWSSVYSFRNQDQMRRKVYGKLFKDPKLKMPHVIRR